MTYWNYRVIHKYHKESDSHTYQIHEVYYDKAGKIEGWTESAMEPMGETSAELREDLRFLLKAFQKPILTETNVKGKDTLVPEGEATSINEGHYSELLDRAWVATDYLYQFLGCHPLLRKEKKLQTIYLKAEEALSELYQAVGTLEFDKE